MFSDAIGVLTSIGITDLIDIAIVTFLVFKVIGFIQDSRAQQLVRGIGLILVAFAVSEILDLNLLNWLLKSLMTVGIIALVIIFQPELRRGLSHIGRAGVLAEQFRNVGKDEAMKVVRDLVDAVDDFSSTHTGALIAIEGEQLLNDIIETGVVVDAVTSVRLLGNLFYEGSPLHDGAVIIRGTRVHAASCVLPLTGRTNIGGNLGTRHRAGVGLSENSDALVIIVSEESGAISVAKDGEFKRFMDLKSLEKMLLDIYLPSAEGRGYFFGRIMGGK